MISSLANFGFATSSSPTSIADVSLDFSRLDSKFMDFSEEEEEVPKTPPTREETETEAERKLRLEALQVTPNSYQKDIERDLPRLRGADLVKFKIAFDPETKKVFNLENRELKYQINYFLHRNGLLYGMPLWYAEDHGYQHSSFDTKAMTDCIMAGEMNITSDIIFINDESGHYKPESDSRQTHMRIGLVMATLRSLGIKRELKRVEGGF